MKYDDQTLIKFANDELEIDLAKEIENEILNDEELKARVEVFSFMTYDKIRHASEIIDIIDNSESSKKENWLATLFINIKTKYKVRTAVISTILAAFIGFSLMPQVATRGVDFLDDSSAKISNTYVYEVRLT